MAPCGTILPAASDLERHVMVCGSKQVWRAARCREVRRAAATTPWVPLSRNLGCGLAPTLTHATIGLAVASILWKVQRDPAAPRRKDLAKTRFWWHRTCIVNITIELVVDTRRNATAALRIKLLGNRGCGVTPALTSACLGAPTTGILRELLRDPSAPCRKVLLQADCSHRHRNGEIVTSDLIARVLHTASTALGVPFPKHDRPIVAPTLTLAPLGTPTASNFTKRLWNPAAPCRKAWIPGHCCQDKAHIQTCAIELIANAGRAAATTLRIPFPRHRWCGGAPSSTLAPFKTVATDILLDVMWDRATPGRKALAKTGCTQLCPCIVTMSVRFVAGAF